jgi:hypothetical protein
MAANKTQSLGSASLLSEADQLIFRAATGSGKRALDAFHTWRAKLVIDELPPTALSAMPLLLELLKQHRIDDPQLGRMRGMGRHIWVSNRLQLTQLFETLDAIAAAGQTAVLLKGAALYARDPNSATKRRSNDYDILIEPASIGAVATALTKAGFSPKIQTWADFDAGLPESATAGVAICKPGFHGEIDLHLRPLPNIFDVYLTRRIVSAAEQATLQGRRVLIPTPAHHLFLALARCEPWDSTESFLRLLEGRFLLACSGDSIDWFELLCLVHYYGLQPIALSYLSTIEHECELPVPPEVLKRLEESQTSSNRTEWALRRIPPAKLSPLQNRTLIQHDVRYHRARSGTLPPGYVETLLSYPLQVSVARPLLSVMWQFTHRRFHGEATGNPRFLYGFSYPEIEGRWTNARYAVVALPLTEAQKRGDRVRLKTQLFCPRGRSASVIATAGDGTIRQRSHGEPLDLAVRCKSLPSLGGDALLLLWLPDAMSPNDAGESADQRMLGLYLYRDWETRAGDP